MKKLVLIAAIAVAGLVQASQVNWALTSPVDAGGTKYRIWTFLASDSSGSTAADKLLTQAAAIALLEAEDYATLKNYNQKGGVLAADGTFTSNVTTDNSAWDAGKTLTGYAIIFDSTDKNLAGVTKYMVTDVQSVTFANAGDLKTFNVTPTGTWTDISPVPEPTSGLLMLVGLGALALRRRKA